MMFMKLEAEFVPAWPESIFPFWCEKIAGSSKKMQHSQNSIFCRTHVRNATKGETIKIPQQEQKEDYPLQIWIFLALMFGEMIGQVTSFRKLDCSAIVSLYWHTSSLMLSGVPLDSDKELNKEHFRLRIS